MDIMLLLENRQTEIPTAIIPRRRSSSNACRRIRGKRLEKDLDESIIY
jgi:hypothetical protein